MAETDIVVPREGTEGSSMESYAGVFRKCPPDRAVTFARIPRQEREFVVGTRAITDITIDKGLLDHADRLELFICMFADTDHVPMDAFANHGVVVTNTGGTHMSSIAEQATGNMSTFIYRLRKGWRRKERIEWRHSQSGKSTDSTVTTISLGSIGQAVARCLQGFEVETIGIRYTPSKGRPIDKVTGFGPDAIRDALSRSDYVAVMYPLNNLAHRFIRDMEFATVSTDAMLVDAARGGIVDTDALASVLRSSKTRGAAFDVTDPGPFPADRPPWGSENCLITPRTNGHMPKHWNRLVDIIAGNLGRLDKGEELENQVLTAESN